MIRPDDGAGKHAGIWACPEEDYHICKDGYYGGDYQESEVCLAAFASKLDVLEDEPDDVGAGGDQEHNYQYYTAAATGVATFFFHI